MRLRTVVLVLVLSACGASTPSSSMPGRALAAASASDEELFDNGIDPVAVGLALDDPAPPATDAVLRRRVQACDAVLRVQVRTVTSKPENGEPVYLVSLRPLALIVGDHPPSGDFTVGLDRHSAGYGIVRNFEGRLVGKTFLAFVRAFGGKDGEPDLRFHLSPDKPEYVAAAATLRGR